MTVRIILCDIKKQKDGTNVIAKLDENFISIDFASLPGNSSPFCDIHLTYKEEHQPQLQLICQFSLRPLTYLPAPPSPSPAWRPCHRYCSSSVEQGVTADVQKASFP